MDLALPSHLDAALDAAAGASPQDLRRAAAWAARQTGVAAPWSALIDAAEHAGDSGDSADQTGRLARLRWQRSGAAQMAAISGLGRGVGAAAGHLAAYGAAHPDPHEALRSAVHNTYRWHVLTPGRAPEEFAATAASVLATIAPNPDGSPPHRQ